MVGALFGHISEKSLIKIDESKVVNGIWWKSWGDPDRIHTGSMWKILSRRYKIDKEERAVQLKPVLGQLAFDDDKTITQDNTFSITVLYYKNDEKELTHKNK